MELKEYAYQYALLEAQKIAWLRTGDRMNARELDENIFRLRMRALKEDGYSKQDMIDFLLQDESYNVV